MVSLRCVWVLWIEQMLVQHPLTRASFTISQVGSTKGIDFLLKLGPLYIWLPSTYNYPLAQLEIEHFSTFPKIQEKVGACDLFHSPSWILITHSFLFFFLFFCNLEFRVGFKRKRENLHSKTSKTSWCNF